LKNKFPKGFIWHTPPPGPRLVKSTKKKGPPDTGESRQRGVEGEKTVTSPPKGGTEKNKEHRVGKGKKNFKKEWTTGGGTGGPFYGNHPRNGGR